MTERGDNNVPIREHLEAVTAERVARFEGLLSAHDAVHTQEAVSRAEAAKRIDSRLEMLNELRSEVITDRGRFISREAFDAKIETLEAHIDVLHDQITEWKGREQGLSIFAQVLVGVIGLAATLTAIYFAFN